MITNLSNPMPRFTNNDSTKSAGNLDLTFLKNKNRGKTPLHRSMVHVAHQYSPKARFQNEALSNGLPLYQAMKYSMCRCCPNATTAGATSASDRTESCMWGSAHPAIFVIGMTKATARSGA